MKRFIKLEENFICSHCGKTIHGTGYTNHCPHCLWSKHVDISPGDRAMDCGGEMEPVDIYLRGQEWTVVHKCQLCGEEKKVRIAPEDNMEAVIKLQETIKEKKVRGV